MVLSRAVFKARDGVSLSLSVLPVWGCHPGGPLGVPWGQVGVAPRGGTRGPRGEHGGGHQGGQRGKGAGKHLGGPGGGTLGRWAHVLRGVWPGILEIPKKGGPL